MGGFLVFVLNVLALVAAVAYIFLLIHAFRRSAGWGLAVLFLSPFSTVIFAIKNWEESRKPFLVWIGSGVAGILVLVGLFGTLGGFGMIKMANQMSNGQEITDEQARQFMGETLDKWENSGVFDKEERAKMREMRRAIEQDGMGDTGAPSIPAFRRGDAAPAADDSGLPASISLSPSGDFGSSADLSFALPESEPRHRFPVRNGYMNVPLRHADDYVGEKVTVTANDGLEYRGTLAGISGGTLTVDRYLRSGTFSVLLPTRDVKKIEVAAR